MARILFKRGTSAMWASANPVLHDGEPGFESNKGRLKIGDGVTPWLGLPYVEESLLNAHISSETPHPIYDDGPDLALLYENAKV